ncbi:EAL domain-containing protein [Aliidiomarina sp. Khilg15.8]
MTAAKVTALPEKRDISKWCRKNLLSFTKIEAETQVMVGFLIAVVVVACVRLIENTGGLPSVYEHLLYIPLVLAGLLIGPKVGALAGFVCAIYLSPIGMPASAIAENEPAAGWLLRIALLTMLPAVAGLLSVALKYSAKVSEKAARTYDGTGLPNMKAMIEQLDDLARGPGSQASELIDIFNLKLQNFEDIQHNIGRDKANRLMQEVAKKLKQALAGSVNLGQAGNDQLVGLKGKATESSQAIEKKLKAFLDQPIMFEGAPYQLDATTGMLRVKSEHAKTSPSKIFEQAEYHRFEAEKHNKDFAFIEHSEDLIPDEVDNISQELLDALDRHDINILYQPRLDIHSGYFSVLEAVVQWKHPKRGEMKLEEFLPLLEQPGLVHQFTCWTIKEAFKDINELHSKGYPVRVSLNITLNDIISAPVLCAVARELQFSRSVAKHLYLEVSEKALMKIGDKAKQYLEKLRRLGVNIIVVGFGKGRSTIQALFAMPVDAVKLCDDLVDKAVSNSDGRRALSSVVKIARSKGLITIASGINDRHKLLMLKQIGCSELQGDILSHPVTRKDIPWDRIR